MPQTGTCPDCGRPITLQPSGWWVHDGMPNGCWRLSMDGPSEDECDPDTDLAAHHTYGPFQP